MHLDQCRSMFNFRRGLSLAVGIVAMTLVPRAADAERPRRVSHTHDTDFVPSAEVVTPHVAFARPLAPSLKPKVLFVVWSPSARQVIELQQRLEFDFDFVSAGPSSLLWRGSGQNNLAGATAAEDELGRLAEMLERPWDVLVLGSVPWDRYPVEIQDRILARVEAGAGLVVTPYRTVYTSPGTGTGKLGELDKAATPSPGVFPADNARMIAHGKGRIAFVDDMTYGGYYDTHIGGFVGRDQNRLEPFARTLLWAAGKAPAAALEPAVEISDRQLRVTVSPRTQVAVYRDLETAFPVLYGAMPYELRPYDSYEPVSPVTPSPADASGSVRHDYTLAAGPYLLLCRDVDDAGRVTNWRQLPVTLTSAAAVTAIEVETAGGPVDLAAKGASAWITPDAPVTLRVRASGAPEGAVVTLRLWDREHRLVASAAGPLVNGSFSASVDPRRALHTLLVVTATVTASADGPELAEQRVPLLVNLDPPWRSEHRVRTFGSALMRPDLTDNSISYFPGYDIDAHASQIIHAWNDLTLNNFFAVGVFPVAATNENYERVPSFQDPAFIESQRQLLRDALKSSQAPGHPGTVSVVDDEWTYGYLLGANRQPHWPGSLNQDRSPAYLQAFRAWLKGQYGDLAGLNAAWGSRFASWDVVEPHLFTGTPQDVPPPEAWPSIVDNLAFMNHMVADYLEDMDGLSRKINPGNRLAASAFYTLGMLTGVDHYRWAQHAPHVILYYDWQIWDSFVTEPIGNWFGYGVSLYDPMNERVRAWYHLMRGVEGTSWSREEVFFRPDHTPNPASAAYYEELRGARDAGLSALLRAGRSVNAIGVLYHPRSFFVHSLTDWQERPDLWWTQMFRRKKYPDYLGRYVEEGLLPWEFRFVATEQIAKGDYGRFSKPRVVILPLSEALSDAEVKVLRQFVEEGGVLVGDLNTAMRHPAGRLRDGERGALDDLFGLTRHTHVSPVASTPAPWDTQSRVPINLRSHDETQGVVDDHWPTSHAYTPVLSAKFNDGTPTATPALGGPLTLAPGAKALAALPDGQPAFVVNPVGKGKAIYLNYIPWDEVTYDRIRSEAGIPPRSHQVEESEERIVEMVRESKFDQTLLLNVLTRFNGMGYRWLQSEEQKAYRERLAERTNTLRLKARGHVYDSRRGEYLGETDRIPLRYSPDWVADVFAVLPYAVSSVDVRAQVNTQMTPAVIDYALRVGGPDVTAGQHVVSVTVLDPSGREVPSYAARLATEKGLARGRVWLALDDPQGDWTIRVRDAATGVSGETVVAVAANP